MNKGAIPFYKVGDTVYYSIGGFSGVICDRRYRRLSHAPNESIWEYQLNVGVPGFWYDQKYLSISRK